MGILNFGGGAGTLTVHTPVPKPAYISTNISFALLGIFLLLLFWLDVQDTATARKRTVSFVLFVTTYASSVHVFRNGQR